MKITTLESVTKFINALDEAARSDVYQLVDLLEQYGHALSMPYAKPIGGGLWELRYTGRPQIRILYGFCDGNAILVHVLKKQRPALLQREIEIGRKRFKRYCE